jgi:hypothetical protein
MSETADTEGTPFLFYCDMLALSPEQRTAHQARIARLFGEMVRETQELPDGFAYRFDGEHYELLVEFITDERLCCPFLTFGLEVAPHRGPVWLRLTAQGGVKPFLQEEIGHYAASR